MMAHFPKEIIEKKNEVEMFIKLKNGSIWMLGGTDDTTGWLGTNTIDVVFDEYSYMKEKIWTKTIRPILTENRGTATFIFTLQGRNHGWKLLQYAQQHKGARWEGWILNVNDTKCISQEELDEARKDMPDDLFRQEFLCEAIDDAGAVFRRIDNNITDKELEILNGKFFQLGVDLAKYQDWTVLTPFDLHTFKAGKQDRFNQIDWNLQKAKIEATALRFNRAKIIIDSTGVGDPIYEDLRNKGLNIESYRFTEISRKQLLENLAILLEQDKIKIPNDAILINELKSFQYQLSERGKIKMVCPEGLHDDCVMSLALAVWGIRLPLHHDSIRRSSEFDADLKEFSRFHYDY